MSVGRMRFSRTDSIFMLLFPVLVLRVELSATRLSAVSGQPALDYHLPTPFIAPVGTARLELALSCAQSTRAAAALHPDVHLLVQSERADLNRRSPGPRPGAMNQASLRSVFSDPCGSRTRPPRLERPMTSPEVERAVLGAYLPRRKTGGWRAEFTQRTGRCSNPRLLVFSQVLDHLSYQSTKKARCRCDTGLSVFFGRIGTAKCHVRNG
jgi:hypothetical protein